MAGNLRQVRLGVVRVCVELRAELAHNFTNTCRMTNEGSIPTSILTTMTRHNRPGISDFETEWRTNNLPGQPQSGRNGRFSSFPYDWGGRLRNSKNEPKIGRSIVVDFQPGYIQTGRYVR